MPSRPTVEIVILAVCAFIAGRRILRRKPPFSAVNLFARRKILVCVCAALLVLLVRAVLLPIWPFPHPSIYDEFSYLLQADTFAHGRLTNAPHRLWQFFESIYILQQPTYTSKYPPGQAFFMTIGQRLFGHPWFGVWLSCGALAAALCWALQAWLPPAWALLGAFIALDLCIFSYWMNSYWGGAVAAVGGALITGAYPRLVRTGKGGWPAGLGAVVLLLTRPYEGFLFFAPIAVLLMIRRRRNRARVWLPILALGIAAIAWNAFYDYRVTGHVFRIPYQAYFAQYESVPPLIVLPVQRTKFFRHFDLQFLDEVWARNQNRKARSIELIPMRAADFYKTAGIVFGDSFWLIPLIAFAPGWLRSKRMRPLVVVIAVLLTGGAFELIFYPHYAAPFTAALLILLIQSLRYMRIQAGRILPAGRVAGNFVILAFCGTLLGATFVTDAWHVYQRRTPDRFEAVNARKDQVEADLLANHPGKHVIFVRYTRTQSPHEEWIYNLADIDAQPVIWAQDMGADNSALMAYYPDRTFWMFQPDEDPGFLAPYH